MSAVLIDINSQSNGTFLTYEKGREKKLFACGDNEYGQLGLGHNEKVTVPEEVKLKKVQIPYCLPERESGPSSTSPIV